MEGDGELLRLLPLLLHKTAAHVPFGAAPHPPLPPTSALPSSLSPSFPLNDRQLQRTRNKSAPPPPPPPPRAPYRALMRLLLSQAEAAPRCSYKHHDTQRKARVGAGRGQVQPRQSPPHSPLSLLLAACCRPRSPCPNLGSELTPFLDSI
jgi:hypothetical protein